VAYALSDEMEIIDLDTYAQL